MPTKSIKNTVNNARFLVHIAVNASIFKSGLRFEEKNLKFKSSKKKFYRSLFMSLQCLFDVQFNVPLKRKFVKLQLFLLD